MTPRLTIPQHQLRLEEATKDLYDIVELRQKHGEPVPDEFLPAGQEKHQFMMDDYGLKFCISRARMHDRGATRDVLYITVHPVSDEAAASFVRVCGGSVKDALMRIFYQLMPKQNLKCDGYGTAPGGVVHFIFPDPGVVKYGLLSTEI